MKKIRRWAFTSSILTFINKLFTKKIKYQRNLFLILLISFILYFCINNIIDHNQLNILTETFSPLNNPFIKILPHNQLCSFNNEINSEKV